MKKGLTTTKPQAFMRRAVEALQELEVLKRNIESNFVALGKLLLEIKDNQYYKAEGHANFKSFVEAKFDFGWRKAFYLIQIIKKAKDLGLEDKLHRKGITTLKEIFSLDKKEDIEHLLLLDVPYQEIKNMVCTTKRGDSIRPIEYGEPINYHGLRYAPLNEQGVVYLFAMMGKDLGFTIEAIRTAFPDCVGKRKIKGKKGRLEDVNIEFEYKSSDFFKHKHNIKGCNIIVCWEHDWKDCPIEVISLKTKLTSL